MGLFQTKNSNKRLPTITKYKVVNQSNKISSILYKPLTGKKHQLRIVSKYLNCSIIGDEKYSRRKNTISKTFRCVSG